MLRCRQPILGVGLVWFELLKIEEAAGPTARPDDGRPGSGKGPMRRVALTGATVALVLGLAGVVAISAASQAAEPIAHKAKTLTFGRGVQPVIADRRR